MSTCRIDGSHSAAARAATIAAFGQAVGGPKVLLCSLRAAGVGLNLTRANRAFMMDLWWNPSVEDQAMDRVHRIGQLRPVEIIKFYCRNTVDERMLRLRQKRGELDASQDGDAPSADDVGAGAGEPFGDRSADAIAGTGDDDDLALV